MPPEIAAQLPDTKPTWQDDVALVQDAEVGTKGKYKRYAKNELAPGAEVHEYVGPLGPGYLMFEYEDIEGKKYCRTTNVGPETWHEVAWHEVEQK